MFKTTTASKALYNRIRNSTQLKGIVNITYGDFINTDNRSVPWIGVYRGPTDLDPWTLPNGWRAISQYRVIIQEGGFDEGSAIEQRLEALVDIVLDLLNEDKTLGGTVGTLTKIGVDYSYFSDAEQVDVHFQQADILITAETRVR